MGEHCDKGVRRNGSAEEAIQEEMMQYARDNNFTGFDAENRCLHVFVARYAKSAEAVRKLKMSLDKYHLSLVTIQAFCTVFTPKCSKEAYRAKIVATHSSIAKGLARVDADQLDDKEPWKCDAREEELVTNMSASCEAIKSVTNSTIYFLGGLSAEQYVNMTFELVDAVRSVDNSTHARLQDARTQREVEVRKKTRLGVLDLMEDLLKDLSQVQDKLPKPFGSTEDMLWPTAVYFEFMFVQCQVNFNTNTKKWYLACLEALSLTTQFERLANALGNVPYSLEYGMNEAIDSYLQRYCERSIKPEKLLTSAVEPMKGGCEAQVDQGSDDEDEKLATKLMTYAMLHGFDGCEDNKCLHIFIARYVNYASDAVEKLKNSVDKYALLSVIVQAFCASSLEDRHKENVRRKTVDVVRSLQDAMDLLSNLSNKADNYKPCPPSYPAWISQAGLTARLVVDNSTPTCNGVCEKTLSWEDRRGVHEIVAKGVVAKLNNSTYSDGYYFKALAYLPFTDDGQHAFLSVPVGAEDILRNESKLVKYVVCRYRKRAVRSLNLLREKWNAIEKKGNAILDATFSTSASNLSKRIKEVETRFENDIGGAFLLSDGFRALVALRCGYEFVWYELGYRYFPAGFDTDSYTLATKQDNKYMSNCGQIVFFP